MILRESRSHGCHLQSWIPAAEAVRAYLAGATAESPTDFAVLAHVNYAARYRPSARLRPATGRRCRVLHHLGGRRCPVVFRVMSAPGRAVTDVICRWCHPAMAPPALRLRQ